MTWADVLVVTLLAGAAQAAPVSPALDACQLLTKAEVQAVQKVAVKEMKSSGAIVRTERIAQCVFATSDFTHSVSLAIVNGIAGAEATRAYWRRTFEAGSRGDEDEEEGGESEVRRITGIGSEAFWTGDARAGSLYVLSRNGVLRISVGGVADPAERIRRSTELARTALQRLRG